MTEIVPAIVYILGLFGITVPFLLFPEKIEKWAALLWKIIGWLGVLKRIAKKNYIRYDLRGRVNDYAKGARKIIPDLPIEKVSIEWAEKNTERQSFMDDGRVVVRLQAEDPQDHNFVHAAYLFIAAAFLFKAKRYLSPTQRKALNLHICETLLRKEKIATVDFFLKEYLHPATSRSRVTNYLDAFVQIDQNNLFYPILVKELHYLGNKVFGRRQDALIIKEVNALIDFLKEISNRKIGDVHDGNTNGVYCKFGIIIIGRKDKLQASINPYIKFIKNVFIKNHCETICLLSKEENTNYLEEITKPFLENYELVDNRRLNQVFRYKEDGQDEIREEVNKCRLMVLRLIDIKMIIPSRF